MEKTLNLKTKQDKDQEDITEIQPKNTILAIFRDNVYSQG